MAPLQKITILMLVFCLPLLGKPQPKSEEGRYYCYWMENLSGRFEWVPAEVGGMYRGEGYDRCFALDSCDGGKGESSGGCYKWARAASSPRVLWARPPTDGEHR